MIIPEIDRFADLIRYYSDTAPQAIQANTRWSILLIVFAEPQITYPVQALPALFF
jgi:hypothetical protein